MHKFTRFLMSFSTFVLLIFIDSTNGLLCYRCDSQVEEDCAAYPAPMSVYEDCSERSQRSASPSMFSAFSGDEGSLKAIYIRYRYKLCPLLEKTVKHVMPVDFCSGQTSAKSSVRTSPTKRTYSPNTDPMDRATLVCGKAVTHGPNGVRIRRGCTKDLFLNGTNACVSVSPHGATDVACFCTTDFCNHGVSNYPLFKEKGMLSTFFYIGFVTLGHLLN